MVNYDDIYRNIVRSDIKGDTMEVVWRDPITEEIVGTSNARMFAKTDLKSNMQTALVQGAASAARHWFANLAGSVLGIHAASTVRAMGSHAVESAVKAQRYGVEEQKEAICRAFEKIKDKLEYSQECLVWVARKPSTPPPIPS